jgi:hypothetical protein
MARYDAFMSLCIGQQKAIYCLPLWGKGAIIYFFCQ